MNSNISHESIKKQFLAIIEERLIELDNECQMFRSRNGTVLNIRRIEWNRKTKETNLKWKAALMLGRFASISELKAAMKL